MAFLSFAGALSESIRKHSFIIHAKTTIPTQAGCLFEAGDSQTGAFVGIVRTGCDDSKCSSSAGNDCFFGADDAKSCRPGICPPRALGTDKLRLANCRRRDGCCRVEILHEGEWGTICDDLWSTQVNSAAAVVCAELGCGASIPVQNFLGGKGRIWLDNVVCMGDEGGVSECKHNGWGVHDCSSNHQEDAGVCCSECTSECAFDAVDQQVEDSGGKYTCCPSYDAPSLAFRFSVSADPSEAVIQVPLSSLPGAADTTPQDLKMSIQVLEDKTFQLELSINDNVVGQATSTVALPAGLWASSDPASVGKGSGLRSEAPGGSALLGVPAGGDGSVWQGVVSGPLHLSSASATTQPNCSTMGGEWVPYSCEEAQVRSSSLAAGTKACNFR